MDVDEEDDEGGSTQRPRRVPDYGIEVDFDILGEDERGVSGFRSEAVHSIPLPFLIRRRIREQDSSGEALGEFDASITKLNAEIERMTPNMKAMDRYVFRELLLFLVLLTNSSPHSLDDVETKLVETEKEAEKARKDSKNARDTFNDVKQRR